MSPPRHHTKPPPPHTPPPPLQFLSRPNPSPPRRTASHAGANATMSAHCQPLCCCAKAPKGGVRQNRRGGGHPPFLIFQITRQPCQFERTMIRQLVKAGLKRAVAQGVKLGRLKIDSATERKVRKQLAKGVGILKVAKSLG